MRKFAHIISLIFNPPIFFLTMPFLVVYKQTQDPWISLRWTLFSFVFIFVSLTFLFVGKVKGNYSDLDLSKKEERDKFYNTLLILVFVYLVASFFFRGVMFALSIISIGLLFGMIVFKVVNKYIKASIHVAIICAFVTTITTLFGAQYFLITFWIIPLVGWARVYLKRHTLKEVLLGSVLGSFITIVTFLIGKYIYT